MKLKKFNVFYTTLPCEHELVVKAKTLNEAVKKVKELMEQEVESVRGGWEIKI